MTINDERSICRKHYELATLRIDVLGFLRLLHGRAVAMLTLCGRGASVVVIGLISVVSQLTVRCRRHIVLGSLILRIGATLMAPMSYRLGGRIAAGGRVPVWLSIIAPCWQATVGRVLTVIVGKGS